MATPSPKTIAHRSQVERGEFDVHQTTDRHGSSALHFAAGSGHVHVCAYLIDMLGVQLSQVPRGQMASMPADHLVLTG